MHRSIAAFILRRIERELVKLVEQPCLPKPGHVQAQRQEQEATLEFRQARQHPPGIESAIGRCSLAMVWIGVEMRTSAATVGYRELGILGRNLQVLGELFNHTRSRSARRGSRGAAAPRPELVGPAPKTWWNHTHRHRGDWQLRRYLWHIRHII